MNWRRIDRAPEAFRRHCLRRCRRARTLADPYRSRPGRPCALDEGQQAALKAMVYSAVNRRRFRFSIVPSRCWWLPPYGGIHPAGGLTAPLAGRLGLGLKLGGLLVTAKM